jgi:TnpA family transposase
VPRGGRCPRRAHRAIGHCTDAEIESDHVDTHGASAIGFTFTELLNFRLLPRLQNIGSLRLHRPDDEPPAWPALGGSLSAQPAGT